MAVNEIEMAPAAVLPALLQGAWFRVNIAFDSGDPVETQTVWWLQGDHMFADLRVPLHADGDAESFAGSTTWDESSDVSG